MTGLDVLVRDHFKQLRGWQKIAIITNQTGVDRRGRSLVDYLAGSHNPQVVAEFAPEHGIHGDADWYLGDKPESGPGPRIYSLYGEKRRRPTSQMLQGIDCLVYDIQDIGARFFTYITTMAYCMEEAAANDIPFVVLDRPDPIGGEVVEGPRLDVGYRSFTGYHSLPVRYGMTAGELAELLNHERGIGCKLTVVKMAGWTRDLLYNDTHLPWIPPSPNIRDTDAELLYPGLGSIEGTRISVGRGTATPFHEVGAPYVDANALLKLLRADKLAGVECERCDFTPQSDIFEREVCHGVRISVVDAHRVNSVQVGLAIACALKHLYPVDYDLRAYQSTLGSPSIMLCIELGWPLARIENSWLPQLRSFLEVRQEYLFKEYSSPHGTDGSMHLRRAEETAVESANTADDAGLARLVDTLNAYTERLNRRIESLEKEEAECEHNSSVHKSGAGRSTK